MQLGRDLAEPLRTVEKSWVALGGGELQQLIASQNQFANQVHEPVEHADIHADGGFRNAALGVRRERHGNRFDRRRFNRPHLLQARQRRDEIAIRAIAFATRVFNLGQQAAHGIHQFQQAAGNSRRQKQLAVAK